MRAPRRTPWCCRPPKTDVARVAPLVLEYLAACPEEAAGGFDREPPARVADYFDRLPDDTARVVLRHLAAPAREAVLAHWAPERLGKAIEAADLDEAHEIVRDLASERRDTVLAHVPEHRRKRLRGLARARAGSVGAALSPRVLRLGTTMRLDEARERIRRGQVAAPLCALDDSGRLAGVVDAHRLLAGERGAELAALVEDVEPLSMTSPLESVVDDPRWATRQWLPVVDGGGRLRGVLHRDRAVEQRGRSPRSGVVGPVVRAYVDVLAELLVLVLGGRRR